MAMIIVLAKTFKAMTIVLAKTNEICGYVTATGVVEGSLEL